VGRTGQHLFAASETLIRVCPISLCPTGAAGAAALTPPTMHVADEVQLAETESLTSLCLSSDSRYVLVSVACDEVHLWDVQAMQIAHRYRGHRHGRYVIRSAFGGSDESFVISGSEDTQVYIWHRYSAELLQVLSGHSGAVNAVSWNPRQVMLATASDDHTIRIWAANEHACEGLCMEV